MGSKHQELLLGNNAPGKCFPSQMHHFFSPSPAKEEKFAESAFFNTKMKHLSLNRWIYDRGKTPKTTPGQQCPWQVPSCIFSYTGNICLALAPLSRKNSLCQHFIHTKIKNRRIYEPNGAKHRKLLLGNNAPGKCLQAHMQHFFSPSPAKEEKFAESAFFHTKIKHLSLNRWIYEPIEAKHQKLLLDNNAPGKCLQAHMQHLFSASPAIEKKFAVSAFYSYKNQKLVMKP